MGSILRLGTRSSRLALWQAQKVAALLKVRGVECEIVTIETRGDDIPDRPLPEIGGEGVFTERIQSALREREIDIAVHSLKDLPVEDPQGLCVGAVLGREEARDVLISREGRSLSTLRGGAVIGSSSTRRQAQLLALRPDLVIRPIRGNVETRIRKVESGEYDATVLAGAGVVRLGLAGRICQWLELDEILPAPGQGAIAVQCRTEEKATRAILSAVDEPALHAETDAERGFLRALGGGCSAPVGAFAEILGPRLRLHGRVSALDGSRSVDVVDESVDHAALVRSLADRALREGAADLIASAGRRGAAQPPERLSLQGLRVLVTRAREQSGELCRILAAAGAVPLAVPMIRISALEHAPELDAAIERLASYRWLIFASVNGVEFFMKRLEAIRPGSRWINAPRVAAVGTATSAALGRHGISADFVPAVHTGIALVEGILAITPEGLAGARVLMPRAREGREDAAALLRLRGAVVEDVPAYRTEPLTLSAEDFSLLDGGVDAVLFASSSAVNAWYSQAPEGSRLALLARRAVIACIGPSTASTARDRGLHVDVEAAAHTTEGLIASLGRHFARIRGGTR